MNDITFIPVRLQGIITQDVDGETLILNNQGAEIHQLNEVASFVWGHCDGSCSVESICQLLLKNYNVSEDQAVKDVVAVIEQFKAKGLLQGDKSNND